MNIHTIYYTSHFAKKYKKLPVRIKKLAEKKEKVFRNNLAAKILKTHKLTGKLKNYYAFSINREYRILFCFEKDGSVTFINIGTHAIYQ
ncbi:MAG: type II toxin-antitoxin system mRNA interferase toxin, RelE/StbE family [Candidatus Woesebacteria bacterium]|jgi:addiction module RelE/StbE family toxin